MKQNIDKLTALVMKKYNHFSDLLPSDVALSIILCSRIITGIHTDTNSYTQMLEKLNFKKWSKVDAKEHI